LRELQRAIIYTNELSKQAMEGHVSRAFTVYSVHKGARLTRNIKTSCTAKRCSLWATTATGRKVTRK
jgi:hypothetical protein